MARGGNRLGEDPRQRGGAGRVARQGPAVGLSLSDLVRRSVGRVRTWTVAHAELERERTRCLARIGSNLNQIARWANIHKENAEALEVVAHLVAIERALDTLTVEGEPR